MFSHSLFDILFGTDSMARPEKKNYRYVGGRVGACAFFDDIDALRITDSLLVTIFVSLVRLTIITHLMRSEHYYVNMLWLHRNMSHGNCDTASLQIIKHLNLAWLRYTSPLWIGNHINKRHRNIKS